MRELSSWCILLCIGSTLASPYYYRESKHHSEHHKEYSYGNGEEEGQIPDSFPSGESEVPAITVGKPERYSSFGIPSPVSSYGQSQSGGYSFSSGGMQQGNAQHYSIQSTPVISSQRYTIQSAPVVSSQRYVIQSTPVVSSQHYSIQTSPVVSSQHYSIQSSPVMSSRMVQQTEPVVVKQRIVKLYSYPATSTHSGYYQIRKSGTGNLENLRPLQSESLYSQHHHSTGSVETGQKEESVDSGWEGQSMFGEGQTEVHEESGQTQYGDSFEVGQKEESTHSGRTVHSHYKQQEGGLEVGQKEESLEFGQREEPIPDHNYKKVEHYSHTQRIEVGQKEKTLHPKQGKDFIEQGQKEESIGQLEFGQREEPIPDHNYKKLEHSSYSQKIEVGQKQESLIPGKNVIDEGQKEESIGQLEFGQREEPFPDQHFKPTQQYSQSHKLEVGQREESLYEKPIRDDLGQKEESIDQIEYGQREETIPNQNYKQVHQYSHTQKIDLGQREESYGQREPDRHPIKPGQIEVGQKGQSLYEMPVKDLEPQGQSLYNHNYKTEWHKTDKTPAHFEDGQKEESFFPHSGGLDLGQKEEDLQGLNFESHHRREESHYQKQESIELGQKQELDDDLGQKEELLTGFKPDDLGQREEKEGFGQPTYSTLEVGRKPMSIQNQHIGSSHKKEEILYQKQESGSLEVGQEEVPLGKYDGIGQKEESLSLTGEDGLGQQEVKESSHHEAKTFLTVGQSGLDYSPSVIMSPHSHQHGLHRHHSHTHGYHQGFSFQPCEHGEQHQHGGFGVGQSGHNEEIFNVNKDKETTGFSKEGFQRQYFINGGDDNKRQGHTYSTSLIKNKTTIEVHRSSPQKPIFVPAVSQVTKVSGEEFGRAKTFNLDKKIEDLAMQLELEGISKPAQTTTIVQTTPQQSSTIPTSVHNAEIEELGLENFDIRSSLRPIVTISNSGKPENRINVFETHKEEVGYSPSSQRTYSKKHSRQYSVRQESHGGLPPQDIEHQLEQLLSQTGGSQQSYGGFQSSGGGGWSSYSRSYSSGGSLMTQGEAHHRMSRESDRGADIDSFLSELDKEIARDNKKKGNQGGFVQVSPQQYSPSQSGTLQKTVTSQTSETSSSNGSSGVSSWFKKIGDGISSTYNKAKEKAKDIVSSVKDQMS